LTFFVQKYYSCSVNKCIFWAANTPKSKTRLRSRWWNLAYSARLPRTSKLMGVAVTWRGSLPLPEHPTSDLGPSGLNPRGPGDICSPRDRASQIFWPRTATAHNVAVTDIRAYWQ